MDKKIKEQIFAIRSTGETNMFDVPKVREITLREGYTELFAFLEEDTGGYARFILTGEEK